MDVVDNPYLPFKPGMRWVYEGTSDGEAERTEVVVTTETPRHPGDLRDRRPGHRLRRRRVAEDTYDWYAQDKDGNVWYLGEDTTAYEEDGTTSTEGSWEYGVDGALPGIVMLGRSHRGGQLPAGVLPGARRGRGRGAAGRRDQEDRHRRVHRRRGDRGLEPARPGDHREQVLRSRSGPDSRAHRGPRGIRRAGRVHAGR